MPCSAGYSFDIYYTSVLKRAVRTTWLLLLEFTCPCTSTGGSTSAATVRSRRARHRDIREYGEEQTASWRRSFDAKPPAYPEGHRFDPKNDIRYQRWQDKSGKIRPRTSQWRVAGRELARGWPEA